VDVISKSTVGGLIAGSVAALVDLAVSLLVEGVRALSTVVVALARVAAAALAEELMKIDLPFRDEEKVARQAAAKKMSSLSAEQRKDFGVPDELFDGRDRMFSPESLKEFKRKQAAFIDSLSLDQAAAIATSSRDADINTAIDRAGASFNASRSRLGEDAGRALGDLSRRTGQDIGGLYSGNLEDAKAWMARAQAALEPEEQSQSKSKETPKPANNAERSRRFAEEQERLRLESRVRTGASLHGAGNASSGALGAAASAAQTLADQAESSSNAISAALLKAVAAFYRQEQAAKMLEEKLKNLPTR
jgi:hypothetical protein